jgi:hypothetical protein
MISELSAAGFLAWMSVLFGMAAPGGGSAQPTVTRMIVQEQLIIRIPVRPRPMVRDVNWVEGKGPNCVETSEIRGAMLSNPETVDFVFGNRKRIRAQFSDDCRALDFYGGFYLKPEDDRICVKRDFVHSRVGGSCRIERFRSLSPGPRD